jgi:hypothetical protein
MKRTVLLISTLVLAAAAPAAAKGPADATITGPALDKPITVRWTVGDPDVGSPFGELVEGAGFFAGAFGQTPDPVLAGRPKGDLGPRYTIAYGGLGYYPHDTKIRQDLYPYAAGGPVTYMKPGQVLYDRTIAGGWYRAPESLKETLISIGLPGSAPGTSGSRSLSAWMLAPIAALLLAAVPLARPRTS